MAEPSIVFIIGPTGTGKTDLSVGLAKVIDAEIINCDSVQIYKGLDVISNKPTVEEMSGVPHHLFGIVDQTCDFNVKMYLKKALEAVDDIRKRHKRVIFVGGTNMYAEAVIYNHFSVDDSSEGETESHAVMTWERLKRVNPNRAMQIHPNDHARISAALKNTREHSINFEPEDIRIKNHALILLDCSDQEMYHSKLKRRCLEMIVNRHGLEELYDFYSSGAATRKTHDVIGVKEFEMLYSIKDDRQCFDIAMEKFFRNTVKYSNKQRKWINNRLLYFGGLRLKRFDVTASSNLVEIMESCVEFIERCDGDSWKCSVPRIRENKENLHCEKCDVIIIGELNYKAHLKSKRHKRRRNLITS